MKILQVHNSYLEQGGEDTVVYKEFTLLQQFGIKVKKVLFNNQDLFSENHLKNVNNFFLPAYEVVQHWTGIQMPTSTGVGGGLLFAFAGS